MDIINPTLNEVVVSLVSTGVIAVIAYYWKSTIYPGFQELRDKTKLYKNWDTKVTFESDSPHEIRISLTKLGETVTGSLTFTKGAHKDDTYKVEGRFHHLILTFFYYPNDGNKTSRGTGTLKLENDGSQLNGMLIYFTQKGSLIKSVGCSFAGSNPK